MILWAHIPLILPILKDPVLALFALYPSPTSLTPLCFVSFSSGVKKHAPTFSFQLHSFFSFSIVFSLTALALKDLWLYSAGINTQIWYLQHVLRRSEPALGISSGTSQDRGVLQTCENPLSFPKSEVSAVFVRKASQLFQPHCQMKTRALGWLNSASYLHETVNPAAGVTTKGQGKENTW